MILFHDIKDCCNCNACQQVCPKGAIYSEKDDCGYVYPHIDPDKCIDCGLCQKVCAYQHIEETNTPQDVYVAASKNTAQILKSASGGIFAAIASYILEQGSIVYGAVMRRDGDKFVIEHQGISEIDNLILLQGSKYVQSAIGNCFTEIKRHLASGRIVLFCGTPCQCAGLKGFLRKDYDNLLTIDLICHGVPNEQLFNDYINYSFSMLPEISGFSFRDKSKGWELAGRIDYAKGQKHKFIPAGTSSYYSLFLDAQTYRKNCYSCKYATNHRAGDLTIGDYWGIQKEHPELLSNGIFNEQRGISCIIVNTAKGEDIIAKCDHLLTLSRSDYKKVANMNAQLLHPTREGQYRDQILELYKTRGYAAIDKFYKKAYLKQRMIHSIFSLLPYRLKSYLRRLKH